MGYHKAKGAERATAANAAAKDTDGMPAEPSVLLGVACSSVGAAAAASDAEGVRAPASLPRFAVGDIVRLSVARSKELYDHRKAIVLAVLSRELRVKLM